MNINQFRQQKYLGSLDTSLLSSGRFSYRRAESIHWEILEPIHNELVITPSGLSSRQGDADGAADGFRRVIQASKLLDPGYRCSQCGERHGSYALRCTECGRWGSIGLDTSEELRVARDRGVSAPRV